MCVLPVARQFFQEKCSSPAEALAAYESVELHVMGVIGRLTAIHEAMRSTSPPDPGLSAEEALQQMFGREDALAPIHVEHVTGDDDYERTDPDGVKQVFPGRR